MSNNDTYIDILGQNTSEQEPSNTYNNNSLYDDNNTIQRKQTSDILSTNEDDFNTSIDMNNSNNNTVLSESNTLSDPTGAVESRDAKQKLYQKLLRRQARVTNIELFFDLVFVYASMSAEMKRGWCMVRTRAKLLSFCFFTVSAISETMVDDLTWEVVLEMLVVTLAVWVKDRLSQLTKSVS